MHIESWGRYPIVDAKVESVSTLEVLQEVMQEMPRPMIAYGNGRSYGDSALGAHIIDMRKMNKFLAFDAQEGTITCQSGVLLSEILDVAVPQGWFLRVTPGTKHITVGGAIASDVHGKNHHVEGCFSQSVVSMRIMHPDGRIDSTHAGEELFHATCGGMGLTGVIVDATLSLKKIASSTIEQTTIKSPNLRETFDAFEATAHMPYSVAWIDCLAKGEAMGRSLLMVGDFAKEGSLDYTPKASWQFPLTLPSWVLNGWSVRLFNMLYYAKAPRGTSHQSTSIDSFFYPLDSIGAWNRIYGRNGFTQYQFILPKATSYEGLSAILNAIAKSGKGSFLAVLKLYGKANENYLSFPIEGYSLALDFKIEPTLWALLDTLDALVAHYGGRIYLAKDVRVSQAHFEAGYEHIDTFRAYRHREKLENTFASLQSQRVGI
ncbi:MAG: FAD-linked oxidase [Sulfuricurvum sp. PC08-66]|nr:MAG: FAD-linked oxidase [Sulfuricurvum sp. PC08-66]